MPHERHTSKCGTYSNYNDNLTVNNLKYTGEVHKHETAKIARISGT